MDTMFSQSCAGSSATFSPKKVKKIGLMGSPSMKVCRERLIPKVSCFSLLALHTDKVVNIRIALSRTLNSLYEIRPEFVKHKTTALNCDWSIDDVVHILAQDSDRDVRHFCEKNCLLFGAGPTVLNNSEVFEVAAGAGADEEANATSHAAPVAADCRHRTEEGSGNGAAAAPSTCNDCSTAVPPPSGEQKSSSSSSSILDN